MGTSKNTNSNLLTPLVDAFWEGGKTLVNIISGVSNNINWEKEFEYLKLCNKDEVKPRLLNVKEDNYYKCFTFSLPLGITVSDFTKNLDRFASLFKLADEDIDLLTISRSGSAVSIVLDKNTFNKEKFAYLDLVSNTRGLVIPLGYYIQNGKLKFLEVDLSDPNTPHFSIAGSTGCGKTNGVKLILAHLVRNNTPAQLTLSLCDLKGTELNEFANLAHVTHYTDDPETTCNIIDEIVTMMEERYTLIKNAKCKDIKAYHQKGLVMPYHMLLIDEFPELSILADSKYCEEVDPDVIAKLRRILNKGRSCGIIVGLSSQTNKATTLPTELRSNIPLTIGMKARDESHSIGICGMSGLQNLRGVGMANVYGTASRPYYTIKMLYMPEDEKELKSLLPGKLVTKPKSEFILEREFCTLENTKVVSGFSLNKEELFAKYKKDVPKDVPKKERHRNKKKQGSLADKLDSLD